MRRLYSAVGFVLLVSGPGVAHAQDATPSSLVGASASDRQCDQDDAAVDGPALSSTPRGCSPPAAPAATTSPKRILGLIPNFTTADDTSLNRVRLTPTQKYVLALDQMFDVSAHAGNVLQAGIQQATAGQPHYTGEAFGKRLAAAEADQITSCLFIYGVLPTLLHDDPRYFRRMNGTPISRTWYAVSRTFVSRTDGGEHTFNTSQLAGQLAQASFSNIYYPRQDRTLSGAFTNWAIQLAYNSAFNVVKEFYPDVMAKLHHRTMTP